jgi:hypothetical protein
MKRLKSIRLNGSKPGVLDSRMTWSETGVYSNFINQDEFIELENYCKKHNFNLDDLYESLDRLNLLGYCYFFREKNLYLLFNEPVDIRYAETEYRKLKESIK